MDEMNWFQQRQGLWDEFKMLVYAYYFYNQDFFISKSTLYRIKLWLNGKYRTQSLVILWMIGIKLVFHKKGVSIVCQLRASSSPVASCNPPVQWQMLYGLVKLIKLKCAQEIILNLFVLFHWRLIEIKMQVS